MGEVIRCRGTKICSPFVSRDPLNPAIYYVSAGTAEIFECKPQESHTSLAFSGGEPYGAQFDQYGRIHIADCAHAAVLRVDDAGQPGVMVKAYEERAFRGPNSIAFGADGTIYFTDSGPMGETTLEKPRGSIFSICTSPSGGQILRPLALECLAHPSGITASPADPKILFVAEMMQNRIVRLCQRPSNTYHLNVFYQFAGGLGPSCIACDGHGKLYVGHYDFAGRCYR
uniref:SMP-30/Gluconolactonase/LRE-like region domain-containing protein n=1 Tax=Globisporangium ultimum (strain ATCC 200006 / CBS 805.95 / DAOM BR144) TaxID=431595 RepID=K3W8A4_GLOUD